MKPTPMSDQEGAEELLRAFTCRDLPVIRALADAGLDLDAPGGGGLTVLMRAVLRGQTVPVEWILSAGADPDVRTRDGMTALDFARQIERPELVELLIAAGATETTPPPAEAPAAPPEPAGFHDRFEDRFDDAFHDEGDPWG